MQIIDVPLRVDLDHVEGGVSVTIRRRKPTSRRKNELGREARRGSCAGRHSGQRGDDNQRWSDEKQSTPQRRAVDLKPITKDSLQGPPVVTNLALVYAWTGERDRALEQLEIVATIPAGPSYGDLKFNPCWDPLRGDKRFDKIVAAAKAASR